MPTRCYTDTDRDRVRDLGVRSRIEGVHNGIDTERFTPGGPEATSLITKGRSSSSSAGWSKGNAPRLQFGRSPRPVRRIRTPRSTCVGGDARNELQSLAEELGVRDAVTFCGQVPYDEMPAVYRGADAFILPSRAEGVPRTIMEAMATGVPVVASDLPQVRNLVSDGGYTVNVGVTRHLVSDSGRVWTTPIRGACVLV